MKNACPHARRTGRSIFVALLACAAIAAASEDAPVSPPLGGGGSIVLEPAPPGPTPRRHRPIFVCQESGIPVFTDRPCRSGTVSRDLRVETPTAPGAAPATTPAPPRASTRPRALRPAADVAPADDAAQRCASLRRQLEDIDARMRAGYTAREAARLWQRWRTAKERLRAARC